jgi:hypothetical protein
VPLDNPPAELRIDPTADPASLTHWKTRNYGRDHWLMLGDVICGAVMRDWSADTWRIAGAGMTDHLTRRFYSVEDAKAALVKHFTRYVVEGLS